MINYFINTPHLIKHAYHRLKSQWMWLVIPHPLRFQTMVRMFNEMWCIYKIVNHTINHFSHLQFDSMINYFINTPHLIKHAYHRLKSQWMWLVIPFIVIIKGTTILTIKGITNHIHCDFKRWYACLMRCGVFIKYD
jgi:hypothetical protein